MTTHAEETEAALARARNERTPEAIVSGVKDIVAAEVAALSPDAKIVSTSYFNHTYMPDLVLEWREHGRDSTRPVFIRNTVTPQVVEREVAALARQEPVLLGLETIDLDSAPQIRQTSTSSPVLISDVSSIDSLSGATAEKTASPLVQLLKSSVLRGGRGLLGETEVTAVSEVADLEPGSSEAQDRLQAFEALASTLFEEGAATRLLRAADIVRLATLPPDEPFLAAIEGELADADLRILLPYLLAQPGADSNFRLWEYLGSMMSLSRLEEFASSLASVDITPLVRANLSTWTAKRAQLSFNTAFEEDADDGRSVSWGLSGGLLTVIVGAYRLAFAADGRRLKTREDSPAPTWPQLDEVSQAYRLDSASLQGIVRRVRVSAEESGDVRGDIRQITTSLADSYSVNEIVVRRIGAPDDSAVHVDFGTWLVTAATRAPLSDIASSAIDFLAFRRPVGQLRKAVLLGEGQSVAEVRDFSTFSPHESSE